MYKEISVKLMINKYLGLRIYNIYIYIFRLNMIFQSTKVFVIHITNFELKESK